jgi:hypothetical protein
MEIWNGITSIIILTCAITRKLARHAMMSANDVRHNGRGAHLPPFALDLRLG